MRRERGPGTPSGPGNHSGHSRSVEIRTTGPHCRELPAVAIFHSSYPEFCRKEGRRPKLRKAPLANAPECGISPAASLRPSFGIVLPCGPHTRCPLWRQCPECHPDISKLKQGATSRNPSESTKPLDSCGTQGTGALFTSAIPRPIREIWKNRKVGPKKKKLARRVVHTYHPLGFRCSPRRLRGSDSRRHAPLPGPQ